MKHIIALIQKMKDRKKKAADVTRSETTEEWGEEGILQQWLREDFDRTVDSGEQVLTPEKTASILNQLHHKMEAQERQQATVPRLRVSGSIYRRMLPRVAAVAGLIMLAGLGMIYYSQLQRKGHHPIAVVQHVKFIRNTTGKIVKISLPEGSQVTMEPAATLSFSENAARDVTLQGKAAFSVQADEHHPFTVYAGNIVTTALGTVFTVDAQAPQQVMVKLETGKVLVRTKDGTAKEDICLLPGEAFHFDSSRHTYSVTKANAGSDHISKTTVTKHAVLMAFNNAPLYTVLNKLQTAFGVSIHYEHSDVDGAYFTGQVMKTDSLRNILEVICQLNNLELIPGEGNMSIRKIR
ncbi:FecR family protein [Chitinophaga sp. HK235]|uniref:FecR family protein n=1 Tax=Chitinophaga sp. HK235 TaxID=2952571 RepID=UPI001BA5EB0E|nr:FecR family protein [Chitinophaga sp. HK235]